MKQFSETRRNLEREREREREREIRPGGLRHIHFGVCASVLSVLCAMPSFGATNSQITRLLQQKKQKMAQLEQCAQKVKGFKIAGISTLGLTAVGVGGNIALASKNKSLDRDIDSTQSQIESEKGKLEKIQADIAAEELKQAKDECKARGIGWEWTDDDCKQKVVENNTTTDTATDNGQSGEAQDNQNSGQGQTAQKSSLEECLERRKNMNAEVRACCYVGTNVAKGDEANQKCNCVNGGTFKFDEKNISKGGTCEVSCRQEVKTLEARAKEVTKGQALTTAEKIALGNLDELTNRNCETVKTGLQNAIKKYENIAKEQSEKANQEKEKWDKMKKNPKLTCCYVETWMVRDYDIPARGGGRCACVQDYKTVDASNPKTLIDGWGKDNGVKNFVCDDKDHNTRAGTYGQSARQCYSPDTDKFYEFLFKK